MKTVTTTQLIDRLDALKNELQTGKISAEDYVVMRDRARQEISRRSAKGAR